jgi:hypothetical protein
MDSLSHVYLADRLLVATGGPRSAAICSLLPQVDRVPAYLHRMYAHPFSQATWIVEQGLPVLFDGGVSAHSTDDAVAPAGGDEQEAPVLEGYVQRRVASECDRMRSFERQYEADAATLIRSDHPPDETSALLAFVSHTYQDIYNNPMQAFLPHWPYPCGAWELWTELGAIDFRPRLYEPGNIERFRADFFFGELWETQLDALALIHAMVRRTALSCAQPVSEEAIERSLADLGAGDADPDAVRLCTEFLERHDQELVAAMRVHSATPTGPAAEPIAT